MLNTNRKYQDMQDRLDNLYDRIDELEDAIAEVTRKMNGASGEQVTAESLRKILLDYDRMYAKMSDSEKKQFFQSIIKSTEIDSEAKSKTRVLKYIEFKFSVGYDAEEGQFLLPTQNDVESCVLLERVSNRKADSYVKLNVKMEDYYRIKDAEGGEADG